MEYSFNTHRMFFNRVTEARIYQDKSRTEKAPVLEGGTSAEDVGFSVTRQEREYTEIDDDQLYRVVTGMYSAQMLGTIQERSFGLLSIEPKDENGQPVTDFTQRIIYDQYGNEVKEWYALAAYLQSFAEDGLPERYSGPGWAEGCQPKLESGRAAETS